MTKSNKLKRKSFWRTIWLEGRLPDRYKNFLWIDHYYALNNGILTINNIFFMSLHYYLVLTPISFLLKLCGKTFLELKPSKKRSYWKKYKEKTNYKEMY